MNPQPTLDSHLEELGKSSRRAALVSVLGFALVMAALIYAVLQLGSLEARQHDLAVKVEDTEKQLDKTAKQLELARKALSTTRAAVNAFHAGNLPRAVALYDEALAWDPDNAYIQNLRAYSLFRLGRIDDAVAGERRSVAADPQYAWGYLDLARFLCTTSPPHLEEAQRAASKAIELRPELRQVMQEDGEFQRVCHQKIPSKTVPATP